MIIFSHFQSLVAWGWEIWAKIRNVRKGVLCILRCIFFNIVQKILFSSQKMPGIEKSLFSIQNPSHGNIFQDTEYDFFHIRSCLLSCKLTSARGFFPKDLSPEHVVSISLDRACIPVPAMIYYLNAN